MPDQEPVAQPRPWLEQPPENYHVVEAGDGFVYVDKSCHVENTEIGRFTFVNAGCIFTGLFKIIVGQFCMISAECHFHSRDAHRLDHVTAYPLKTLLGVDVAYNELAEKPQGIVIGHDVWLGSQVRVMPGVSIGNGAVVATRAVVTRDLEPYGVYGGVPARLIRFRYPQPIIDALQDVQWWRWPLEKIKRNTAFFNLDLTVTTDPAELYKAIVP
jgi:virginiamycin A acetyltransferase